MHSQYYEAISGNPTRFHGNLEKTEIGSDVWIGDRAWVKKGVKIGNGAIVSSHAVVVKDVPDYAIVAGVPARIIRYRFDEELRARLTRLKWWEMDISPVAAMCDFSDPHKTTTKMENTALEKMVVAKYKISRKSAQELEAIEFL